jgi:hypothetical protein
MTLQHSLQHVQLKDRHWEISGEKGYKTVVCEQGCKLGDYYFEVEVVRPTLP